MKIWVWIVVVALISILTVEVLKVPFWIFIVLGIPLLVIVSTYVSFVYIFNSSLKPEPIPEKRYESRIKDLEKEEAAINNLGFDKKDAFYLKTRPDSITYVFKHKVEPTYLCIYHLGVKKSYDFVTYYEKDISLTSCTSVDAGMVPIPPNRILQIFENLSYERLFDEHRRAQIFIKNKGIKEIDIPSEAFREYFMKSIREFAKHTRTFAFWPVRLIFWTLTKRGKIYLKSIEEQYKSGMINRLWGHATG